ncbi:response regulator [Paenibacillus sp. FSL K6-0276]|uniref:response regulator n=1 Tax=Paenibacillus sp. FSL K6-0276 TaxID=2921450 RepID=UPI0030EDD5F5
MIKVLIVDDEILVRLALKSGIEWKTHGFELIGEADDGVSALKYIEQYQPHIVITDITMPNMNGIELIREAKKINADIHFIILSCHNDFEFVKEGMKLGAEDYILKLSMNIEKLVDILLNLKDKIKSGPSTRDETMVMKAQESDRLNFIYSLFDDSFQSKDELMNMALELGLSLIGNYYVIGILQFDKQQHAQDSNYSPRISSDDVTLNIIDDIMKGYGMGQVIFFEKGIFLYLFSFQSLMEAEKNLDLIQSICEETVDLIRKFIQIKASCGIGSIVEGISNTKVSYNHAYESLKINFYTGPMSVNRYNPSQNHEEFILKSEEYDQLLQAIEIYDLHLIRVRFIDLLKTMERQQVMRSQNVRMYIHKLIFLIETNIKKITKHIGEYESITRAYMYIQEIHFFNEMIEQIDACLQDFITEAMHEDLYACRTEVFKAKEYVLKNYNQPISVATISKIINMNPDYFSHIFKKEAGINFIDYLNEIRIDKAKELMRKQKYKIYQIAEMVGYNNDSYFIKKFKQITGYKPLEYMNEIKG